MDKYDEIAKRLINNAVWTSVRFATGGGVGIMENEAIQDIANAIRAAVAEEREACAELADHFTGPFWPLEMHETANKIAAAIRAREK